jgi:hypothetical protein
MILHDEHVTIIVVACRKLDHCQEATEAEMMAIEEGLKVAMHWFPGKILVETDYAEAAKLIKDTTHKQISICFFVSMSFVSYLGKGVVS